MKITMFNGSSWNEEGHTHAMAQEFLAGAVKGGAKVQIIHLASQEMKPCTGCCSCLYKTPGKCVFDDDMSPLIHKFVTSDFVIFATPVYMDNVSGIMKSFIDRLMPVFEPYLENDSSGEYRRGLRYNNFPKFLVISSCALPEQSNFQVVQLFFHRMARTMHTEVVGEIYRTAGGLLHLSDEESRFRPAVDEYKKRLRAVGEEFVKIGNIDARTRKGLEEPLVSADEYVEYANEMWDRIMSKSS